MTRPLRPRLPCASALLAACLLAACASPNPTDAGGNDTVAPDAPGPDAPALDAPALDAPSGDTPTVDTPTVDAPAASDTGDATACVVADAGAVQTRYYCDSAAIHVLQRDGAPTQVMVAARVGTGAGCRAIDSIEIVRGSTMLQRFDTTARLDSAAGNGSALGSAPAAASLVAECANETTRLTAYGLIVRGRDAMGPFEARCGTADTGSRWPPGTHLACHRNVERGPLNNPYSSILVMAAGPTTIAMLSVFVPHPPGTTAFTTVDSTLRIVSPQRAPFGGGAPLMPLDTTGWMGSASESDSFLGPATQVTLNAVGMTMLPPELCPSPPAMPGPIPPPSPFFLARITGRGPAGAAVTVEVLANCMTRAL